MLGFFYYSWFIIHSNKRASRNTLASLIFHNLTLVFLSKMVVNIKHYFFFLL